MTYIWINPVTESMYDSSVLVDFLEKHNLVWVRCRTDWGRVVKEKYIRRLEQGGDVLADARCPMASALVRDLLDEDREEQDREERDRKERDRKERDRKEWDREEQNGKPGLAVADIEPILIHCGREISGREDLRDGRKIITTPCKALADMGNALMLRDTCFVPWNCFLDTLGEYPEGRKLDASPIPPGFFSDLKERTESLTGKGTIEQYVRGGSWRKVRLVEMLYCDMGCHNGDGVVKDEE